MPNLDSHTPDVANPFLKEPFLPDYLHRRDSRTLECHPPIEEEDESTGTPSESAEPLTPTSHISNGISFSNPFRPDGYLDDEYPTPKSVSHTLHPHSPSPSEHSSQHGELSASDHSDANPKPRLEQKTSTEKLGLGRRVSMFVRSKLHRRDPSKGTVNQSDHSTTQSASQSIKEKEDNGSVRTTEGDGLANTSMFSSFSAAGRRLSAFSIPKSPPRSSRANSPPVPDSPNSTISTQPEPVEDTQGLRAKHSSSTALSNMNRPRSGMAWTRSGSMTRRHPWSRRRSASTEQVSRFDGDEDKPTAGMLPTFSKPPEKGVGMKARRLSLSLPDDYIIDQCELDKEFKSSSLFPGKRGKVCGKGATAEVRIMARKRASKEEELVAVKIFRERDPEETEECYIMKIKSEFSIARSLHHPNIVQTVRLCTNRGRWNHVMEFCSHGEVYSLVERKLFADGVEGYYSQDDRLCFFKQLLRGVDYLHSHGIAHRDIKLENLLVDKEGHLRISDFGVAEVFSGEHPGLRASGGECGKNMGAVRLSAPGICGSLPYIAPEVLAKKGPYDPRPLDIWSCAIVYITMTFGGCPWQAAKTEFEYYARFKKGWEQWLADHPDGELFDGPDGYPKCGKLFNLIEPPAIKHLMLKMLHPIPEKRITIRELLKTKFIMDIDCCCPEQYETDCCTDTSKLQQSTAVATKRYSHHHIPPTHEQKSDKGRSVRFEVGEA
jgi:protein-serine/threonine kinase